MNLRIRFMILTTGLLTALLAHAQSDTMRDPPRSDAPSGAMQESAPSSPQGGPMGESARPDQPSDTMPDSRRADAPASESSQMISKENLKKDDIRKVQSALNEQGYDAGSVDGVWGNQTDRALRDFQNAKGIDASGQLDQQTLLALGMDRDEITMAKVADPSSLDQTDVQQVQEALKDSGYDVGTVDGKWGPKTQSALSEFQQAKGIDANGQLDRETVLALDLPIADFAAGEFAQEESTPSQ